MTSENPLSPLRDLRFTEQEKRLLRQRLVDHQQRSFRLRKLFFVSRITGYVAVSCFGIVVLVSSFIPQPQVPQEFNQALFTLVSDTQTVQATTLGRLLEIQGVVHVINNGIILPKTDIEAGEIVVLQPGAELVVQIRSHMFATITGPAKFVLEYIPETNQTIVNLLEGRLIEVATQKITSVGETQDSENLQRGAEQPQESIVIKTKLVEVTPPSDQETTFTIEQEDTSAEVIARSGNVVVKHLIIENDQHLTVDAGQVAQVGQYGMEIGIPETNEAANHLARISKDLHIRYMVETRSGQPYGEGEIIEADKENQQAPLSRLEEVVQQTTTQTKKRVLDLELMKSLEQALHPSITTQNLAQMREWKESNTDAYIIAYRNLLDQLNRAYTLLDITQPTTQTDSLSAGIHVANNLIAHLDTTTTLPPSLRSSLLLIVNGLGALQTPPPQDTEEQNSHNTAPELPTSKSNESGSSETSAAEITTPESSESDHPASKTVEERLQEMAAKKDQLTSPEETDSTILPR